MPADDNAADRPVESNELAARQARGSTPPEAARGREAAAVATPAAGPGARPALNAVPHEGSADEESIDAYMAKLLNRVRSGSNQGETATSSTETADTASLADDAPVATNAVPGTAGADAADGRGGIPAAQAGSRPLTRRAAAPQDAAGMSALREVANVAARSAIAHHGRRRLLKQSTLKLLVSLSALLCGGVLVWAWRFFRLTNATFYAGMICLVAGLFWSAQYAALAGKLIVRRPKQPGEGPKAEVTETKP